MARRSSQMAAALAKSRYLSEAAGAGVCPTLPCGEPQCVIVVHTFSILPTVTNTVLIPEYVTIPVQDIPV